MGDAFRTCQPGRYDFHLFLLVKNFNEGVENEASKVSANIASSVPSTIQSGPPIAPQSSPPEAPTPSAVSVTGSDSPPVTTAKASQGKWQYSQSVDNMRNETKRHALVVSNNSVDFAFPYSGGSQGKLRVRQRGGELSIMFSITKGNLLCSRYSNDTLSVKFDDGTIREFRCWEPTDGSSELVFLSPEVEFLQLLRSSSRVVVEASFYQEGSRQFIFDTAGLSF